VTKKCGVSWEDAIKYGFFSAGRRANWIHIGSEQAGPRVAVTFSVIESCRQLKTPVREYLADIPCSDLQTHRVSASQELPLRLGL